MYQKILVPIDGSSTSNRGLLEAIRLAGFTGGRLRLVHVIDELSFALAMDAYAGHSGDWIEALRAEGGRLLTQAQVQAHDAGIPTDNVLFDSFRKSVHEQVVAESITSHADLIVLGTHGRRGLARVLMGSDAEQIARTAPVPVLLVRLPAAADGRAAGA